MIAGTIPVNLLEAEWMEIYMAKSAGNHRTGHFMENTVTKWQRQWNDEDRMKRGRWRDLSQTRDHGLVGNLER